MRFISKLLPASKRKLVVSSIGILALVVFTSIVVFETTKAEVVIADNGEEKTVKTHKNTVEELLEEVGITVGEHDQLSHELSEQVENGMTIDYEPAKQVTVAIDGKENTYYSTADTVGEFLEEEGLSFSEHDEVSLNNTDTLKDGLKIDVSTAFEVTINDGGKKQSTMVTGGTVQELLEKNEIILNDHDKIEPALDDQLTEDTSINIVRVEIIEEEVEEKVAFDTVTKQDDSLEKGKEKVITEGEDGRILKTFEVTLENGEEVDRELVDEIVKEDQVNRVVAVGTKEPEPAQNLTTLSSSSDSSQSSNSSGKTLTMTASAFTSSCNGCSGYTATGINLKDNPNRKVIAVDPNVIPLGSKVWVEGYGEAVAGDTGGHITGNRIDLHVPNKSEAYNWGVRKVQVKILD
ncbi:G5 and 3D domain-containing protein [Oceanobacillus salinisoli]|uniref:G5 and 3D domain-containing protein n=1 Tax=Oceanobacillus salinisoli TaxID=2678611 RepID=UPI0012E2C106|nr:G5 and 3D domain-containing protein [Oceanobacillus salinisoli]